MVFPTLLPALLLAALTGGPAEAEARQVPLADERPPQKPTANQWVAMVVTKITRAGGRLAADAPGGTATIRVRIGTDGALEGAAIEASSGSPTLDERVLKAARAASPFAPPPAELLTLEGFTELSFGVEFLRAGR